MNFEGDECIDIIKPKSVRSNYIYNTLSQVCSVIVNFFSMPILANNLGVEAIGVNAFVLSIVTYFVYTASLGINIYGNKEVAIIRSSPSALNSTFSEIFSLQLLSFFFFNVIYILLVSLFGGEMKVFFWGYSLMMLAATIDISWFYIGIEEFRRVALRAVIIKILGFVLIVFFIKEPADLILYIIFIQSVFFVSNTFYWVDLRRRNISFKFTLRNTRKHLSASLLLFIPQISITIYALADRTMLGIFSSSEEVGVFDYSENLIKVLMLFLASLGSVLIPRIANLYSSEKFKEVYDYVMKMMSVTAFFSIPFAWGICSILNEIIAVLMNHTFHKASVVMSILSPIIVITGCSLWNVLVAVNRYRKYVWATILGVIVNILVNLLLIPSYGAVGAAIATVCTEFAVQSISFFIGRDLYSAKRVFKNLLVLNLLGFLMYASLMIIHLESIYYQLVVKIIVGSFVYILLAYIFNRKLVRLVRSLLLPR